MCCEDPDDFEMLKARAWNVADFRTDDLVELWPADCTAPPIHGGNSYVRLARVLTTVTAGGEAPEFVGGGLSR